ncbi:MAG: PH domain-containing protein [Terriglobales bacterium]
MKQTFPIAPSLGASWLSPAMLIGIAATLAFLFLVLIVWPRYNAHHVRFEVDGGGLTIKGDLYGRTVPWNELELSQARALNLKQQTQFRLTWRTNGLGLPGYSSGWFKLADGEKALAFITDPTRVAYIPTSRGYAVMLSVADPRMFLESLRQHSAG